MTLLELKWDGQLDVLRSKQRNLFQTRALQLLDCYLNSLVYDPNWASVEEFFKDDIKHEDPVQAPIPQETAPAEIAPSIVCRQNLRVINLGFLGRFKGYRTNCWSSGYGFYD